MANGDGLLRGRWNNDSITKNVTCGTIEYCTNCETTSEKWSKTNKILINETLKANERAASNLNCIFVCELWIM